MASKEAQKHLRAAKAAFVRQNRHKEWSAGQIEHEFTQFCSRPVIPQKPIRGAVAVAEWPNVKDVSSHIAPTWFSGSESTAMHISPAPAMARDQGFSAQSVPARVSRTSSHARMSRRSKSDYPTSSIPQIPLVRWQNDVDAPFCAFPSLSTSFTNASHASAESNQQIPAVEYQPCDYIQTFPSLTPSESALPTSTTMSFDSVLTDFPDYSAYQNYMTTADDHFSNDMSPFACNDASFANTDMAHSENNANFVRSGTLPAYDDGKAHVVDSFNALRISANATSLTLPILHPDHDPLDHLLDQLQREPQDIYPPNDQHYTLDSFNPSVTEENSAVSHAAQPMSRFSSHYSMASNVSSNSVQSSHSDSDGSVISTQGRYCPSQSLDKVAPLMEHSMSHASNKVAISRKPSSPARDPVKRFKCEHCPTSEKGFRGIHELQRHQKHKHPHLEGKRKYWVCVDVKGQDPKFLAQCKSCVAGKRYGSSDNSAAHLRRIHFHPRKRGRRARGERKRGGSGGGNDPPIEFLKEHWMQQIEEDVCANDAVSSECAGDEDDDLPTLSTAQQPLETDNIVSSPTVNHLLDLWQSPLANCFSPDYGLDADLSYTFDDSLVAADFSHSNVDTSPTTFHCDSPYDFSHALIHPQVR